MSLKDDFKKGCVASGGDFVENASDDSYGCNIKTGGSIDCSKDDPCVYNPKIEVNTSIVVSLKKPGIGELITLSPGGVTRIRVDLTRDGVWELLSMRRKSD